MCGCGCAAHTRTCKPFACALLPCARQPTRCAPTICRYKELDSRKGPRAAAAARGAAAKERCAAAAAGTVPSADDAPAAGEAEGAASAPASGSQQPAPVAALDPEKVEAAICSSWDRIRTLCERGAAVCAASGAANTHVVHSTLLRGLRAVESAVHAHVLQLEAGEQAAHQLQLAEGASAWWGITRLGASGLDSGKSRRATQRARAAEARAAAAAADSDDDAPPQPFLPADAEQRGRKRQRDSDKEDERADKLPAEWMELSLLGKVAKWCNRRGKVPFEVRHHAWLATECVPQLLQRAL